MAVIVETTNIEARKQLCIDSGTTVKELAEALAGVPEDWSLENVVGYDEAPVYLKFREPGECKGIEIEPGVFSGCAQRPEVFNDCPRCGSDI